MVAVARAVASAEAASALDGVATLRGPVPVARFEEAVEATPQQPGWRRRSLHLSKWPS